MEDKEIGKIEEKEVKEKNESERNGEKIEEKETKKKIETKEMEK